MNLRLESNNLRIRLDEAEYKTLSEEKHLNSNFQVADLIDFQIEISVMGDERNTDANLIANTNKINSGSSIVTDKVSNQIKINLTKMDFSQMMKSERKKKGLLFSLNSNETKKIDNNSTNYGFVELQLDLFSEKKRNNKRENIKAAE